LECRQGHFRSCLVCSINSHAPAGYQPGRAALDATQHYDKTARLEQQS